MPYLRPFLPLLLSSTWPSSTSIITLPSDFPVLFLAGERDEIVEPGQMKGLFAVCSSEKKEWRSFRYGMHKCVDFRLTPLHLPLPPPGSSPRADFRPSSFLSSFSFPFELTFLFIFLSDTCNQPFYFAYIARFITSTCSLPLPSAFDSALPHLSSLSNSNVETAAPTSSDPSSGFTTRLAQREAESNDFALRGDVREPLHLKRCSVSSESKEEEKRAEGWTEGERLESSETKTAGSLGPREEAKGLGKEVRKKLEEL